MEMNQNHNHNFESTDDQKSERKIEIELFFIDSCSRSLKLSIEILIGKIKVMVPKKNRIESRSIGRRYNTNNTIWNFRIIKSLMQGWKSGIFIQLLVLKNNVFDSDSIGRNSTGGYRET